LEQCHEIRYKDTQHNDIQHNDIQHNDIQHNGTRSRALLCQVSFMLNVVILCVTNKPFMLSLTMLNVIILSVVILNVAVPVKWLTSTP
jgi:hypothetical protein